MAATIDQQFVEYIVKSLVSNPDAVSVNRTIDEKGVLLELKVDGADLGRVIGRGGATAKSIRTLLRALGVKNDARYNLKIVDTGPPRPTNDYPAAADTTPPADEPVPVAEPVAAEPFAPVEAAEPSAPAEEVATETAEPDDSLQRHRDDLKELTDLDI